MTIHKLDHCFREGLVWMTIACRVASTFGNRLELGLSLAEQNDEAFASVDQTHPAWPGVVQDHVQGAGEVAVWVPKELEERSSNLLLFAPGFHHCTIVDAVHHDFFDSLQNMYANTRTWCVCVCVCVCV